jgi:hypothetical protein
MFQWIMRVAQTNALKLVYLRSLGSIAAGSIVPVVMATRQRGPSNWSATRGLSTNAVSRANTRMRNYTKAMI